jgi:callose synthase
MASKADHEDKRNYDDFNEFFWSRNCLRFRYSSDIQDSRDVEYSYNGPMPDETLEPVSDGLTRAPKTFLEKRSWLRGILALSRIAEWHIVTFYVLGVIAFARDLVWGWVYFLQVASAVFWLFNALHLLWALLEVWASYPGIQLSGTDVCGSVFVLVARFITLVYQTLYLMWAFSPQKGIYLGMEGDSIFWWWQYVWLSLLVMIPYFIEFVLQLVPAWATKLYTSQNDFVQSFLNILYPLSRLYVGKEVHESFGHTVVYVFFWATMLAWKLFFSYIFEVYSMVLPSLQLMDDYLNYPDQSFFKMILLLGMRWLPQFIVYVIDLSIWYAVWQAFAGTSVGLSDHLGDIRSIDDIRKNFGRAPEHFCKKMLSPDAGSRRGSSASFLGSSGNNLSEGTSLLGADPHRLQSYVNRLLDVRIQKWVMFSAVWNEIIDHFRQEDIISNTESDNLKFSQFDGFSQAIYLPVFQTAGVVEDVLAELERPADEYKDSKGAYSDVSFFKPISEHVTRQTAVAEVWELGSFVLLQTLGSIHSSDVHAIVNLINKWAESGNMTKHLKLESIRSVMNPFVDLVNILHKGIRNRKPTSRPKATSKRATETKPTPVSSGLRRVVSAGSLLRIEPDTKVHETERDFVVPLNTQIIDALRDQVRDKLRSLTHAVKNMLKDTYSDAEARDVLDRFTFLGSMENGFFWDDNYASDQLDEVSKNQTYKDVLKKIHGLACMHPDDAEPKSKEARRRLTFFVNTLFMDMPYAPSIHDMFSWNVLTPYYSEDVTYSRGDLEKRTDALGVSTLLYLQTLYRSDWNNFLERMGIKDEDKIYSKKNIDETRRWASIRAQTLARTVNGMMYCEKALRLLANLERLDDDTTNDLMGEKFGYVVSCQVYGAMKRDQDSKADDIDALLHRFPHLRVAYIDTVRVNRAGTSVYYSCLVKSDGKGNIIEVYRVRLPDNPVIGEGKPENQNHAVIFTRGEFIQTIDMNQEGYFEEALKMRNCLQEFAKREGPLPTTILGLREHIFTGSVSSLANYMALQEHSFVTLGQRVLTRPLHIRLHYGHPDVFDKLFFITRGGFSKASKGINLSEDIFAGYNNVVRGGSVGFKEYVQVGKGRDVGMSQIYKFEAKLSQGAAEQSLSRDVYRMCNRLDFCRLLSFYYGGIGHYFSNVLTILTVYVVVYLMTVLALFDLERIGDRLITPMGTIQMLLGGLGLLQTIPLFATLGVERGWWASLQEIFLVFATGGPLHFMFHIQTKAYYMSQTILVGGAKYRPTGRGFVTQHTPFDEQYRFFAASHLYLGMELAAGLILMGMYTDAGQYFGRTWSLWLASASFLCSPFWFNPLTFDWNVVLNDYCLWFKWIRGTSGGISKSWSMWYNDENAYYKGLPLLSKGFYLIKAAVYLLIAEGIRKSSLFKADTALNKPVIGVGSIIIFILVLVIFGRLFSSRERTVPYPIRRTIGIVLFLGIVAGIVTLVIEDTNYIRFALAGYYALGALAQCGLLFGVKAVKHLYFVHDIVCGHVIFFPLFISAALQLPGLIQTWLLYHNALSTDVVVSDILRYARKSQESGGGGEMNEDIVEQISELKKLVQRQEQALANAGLLRADRAMMPSVSSNSVADLLVSSGNEPQMRNLSSSMPPNRAFSMSGLDLWSNMALGDVQTEDLHPPSMVGQDAGTATMSTSRLSTSMDGFSFAQPDVMPPR